MKKILLLAIGPVLVAIASFLVVGIFAGMAIVSGGAAAGGGAIAAVVGKGSVNGASCTIKPASDSTVGPSDETGYDTDQIKIIQLIVSVGKAAGVPEKGWIVALMVAMQESGIRNLDHGDADSLGLMQQRPSMQWGSPAQLQNPAYAIQAFYLGVGSGNTGLMQVPNWDMMIPTVAAQTVQGSAYPDAYAKHQSEAARLIDKYKDTPSGALLHELPVNSTAGNANTTGGSTCGVGGTPGSINAAGDDYPGRNWTPDQGSVAGGLARECVDFTAWRMRKLTKGFDASDPFYGTWYNFGNGAQWGPAAKAAGYQVDRNPKAGDIAYWTTGTYGHVAFVNEVKGDGTVNLEEYNWLLPGGGSDYSYHTRTVSSADPAGFIHIIDDPKHPLVPSAHSQMG